MEFEIVEKIKTTLGPLGVKVTVYEKNNIYYLELDGTGIFPDAADWEVNWGRNFAEFTKWYVKGYVKGKPKSLTETHVKYKIGSLMDILKDAGK